MRTSALFGAKTFEFFKIYGVFARTREREVCRVRIFCRQVEKGSVFRDVCADVFYERPLTKKEVFYDSNGSHNKEWIKTSRASK